MLAQLSIASAYGTVFTGGLAGGVLGPRAYPLVGASGAVARRVPDRTGLGLIFHGEGGLPRVHGIAPVGEQASRERGTTI